MAQFELTKPVVLIIFKRPDTTSKIFEAIRKVQPKKLYIFADGSRNALEEERCQQTKLAVENVDWPCEVFRDYSDINLGVEKRVISALNIVFENENDAIILEDDCLPDPTFFRFCEELLEKYRDDNRVMSISGSNFQFERASSVGSYHFSKFPSPWGWATWKRAWALYDENLTNWLDVQKGNWLHDILNHAEAEEFWWRVLQDCYYKGPLYAWDYVWKFSCWIQSGLAITPNKNLIENIGFGDGATHTFRPNALANIIAEEMEFPIEHPRLMICNERADRSWKDFRYSRAFSRDAFVKKMLNSVVSHQSLVEPLLSRSIKRVALFGTLPISTFLADQFRLNGIEVVAFLDNNISDDGSEIKGIKVYRPSWLAKNIDQFNVDAIISTVLGEHEKGLLMQLVDLFNPKVKILSWVDLVAWNDKK